jgi:REP element-mobilizing transposase RayT
MARMLGYMITWTTYGSWLQGDERGFVKDGRIVGKNEGLRNANVKRLKASPVEFGQHERQIVREAIIGKAEQLGQKIHALAVCSNHVHVVAERISQSIEMVVSHHKNAARLALQANGFVGRVWTRGFDKRYCFDRQQLQSRIKYVQAHDK